MRKKWFKERPYVHTYYPIPGCNCEKCNERERHAVIWGWIAVACAGATAIVLVAAAIHFGC